MKTIFLKKRAILIAFMWFLTLSLNATPPNNLNGWNLIFNDEFDGSSLDKSKWNPTYNWGHTHNHQAYCAEENVSVENGYLKIKGEARRHPDAPATCSNGGTTYSLDYTSGAIDTKGKFSTKYGYIEGRFKMPSQLGTWPAFWMLQDGWPPEIDIFEVPHARTDHHYYLHYTNTDWYAQHGSAWDHEASFGGVHSGPDKSADFHTYGLEWTETTLNFYFDDNRIASYNRPSEISQTQAMYIIVNLAIGGWATSNGNSIQVTSSNPAYLQCDWIRAWSLKESPLTSDTVRIFSLDSKLCLQASDKDIVLGNCNDPSSIATLSDLGNGAYRINFGENVLEVPNESKDAGDAVGLWGWNGKSHQQINLIPVDEYEGLVVNMKFVHSGYYIQTNNSDVIQNALPASNLESSLWQLIPGTGEETSIKNQPTNHISSIYTDSDILKIKLNKDLESMVDVRIYREDGVQLQNQTYEGKSIIEVPISLPLGIYLLELVTDKTSESYKFIVNQ